MGDLIVIDLTSARCGNYTNIKAVLPYPLIISSPFTDLFGSINVNILMMGEHLLHVCICLVWIFTKMSYIIISHNLQHFNIEFHPKLGFPEGFWTLVCF